MLEYGRNILFAADLSMPFSPENREIRAKRPSQRGTLRARRQKFGYPAQNGLAAFDLGARLG